MTERNLKKDKGMMTKNEACQLLKINLNDLKLFEGFARILNKGNMYSFKEFSRLRRFVANFNDVIAEEKAIRE